MNINCVCECTNCSFMSLGLQFFYVCIFTSELHARLLAPHVFVADDESCLLVYVPLREGFRATVGVTNDFRYGFESHSISCTSSHSFHVSFPFLLLLFCGQWSYQNRFNSIKICSNHDTYVFWTLNDLCKVSGCSVLLTDCYSGDQIKKIEMGRECSTMV